jgi:ABC-type transporter Mla subunit MlaD
MYEIIIGFLAAIALYGLFFTFLYLFKENNLLVSSEKLKKFVKFLIIGTMGLCVVVTGIIIFAVVNSKSKNQQRDFIVKMEDATNIGHSSDVYYKGVEVGNVKETDISEDGNYALITFRLKNKHVKIVQGTKVKVVSSTLSNDLGLVLPPKPETKKELPPGSILEQYIVTDEKDFNSFMNKLFSQGKADELVNNMNESFENINALTKDLQEMNARNRTNFRSTMANLEAVSANLKESTVGLKKILGDERNIKNISSTIENTDQAMKNLSKTAEDTASLVTESTKSVKTLNDNIGDKDFQKNIKDSASSVSGILKDVNSITSDEKTMQDLKDLINETGSSLKTINCVTKEMGNTLGKRFLIPRMLLGRPGKNIEICFPDNSEAPQQIQEPAEKLNPQPEDTQE